MFNAKALVNMSTNKEANFLYHKALKKVEHYDFEKKESVKPEKENAWKFELFLQNFMPLVEQGKLGVLEVNRDTEFAPIKNANQMDMIAVDSPDSASQLMILESTMWS